MPLEPARVLAGLEELRELTGDENGAQRVAWSETWERARGWLREGWRRPAPARRSTRRETSGSRSQAGAGRRS